MRTFCAFLGLLLAASEIAGQDSRWSQSYSVVTGKQIGWDLRQAGSLIASVTFDREPQAGERVAKGVAVQNGQPLMFVELNFVGADASGLSFSREVVIVTDSLNRAYAKVGGPLSDQEFKLSAMHALAFATEPPESRPLRLPFGPSPYRFKVGFSDFPIVVSYHDGRLTVEPDMQSNAFLPLRR